MATVRLTGLSRELTFATRGLTGDEARRAFANFSRSARDEVLAAKAARSGSPPRYTTAVNGRLGVSEDSVVLPGPIVYTFDAGSEIATYLLDFLQARAPKDTGDYAKGFFFIQDNRRFVWPTSIDGNKAFYITNDRPFSRKIEIGAMKMRVPPHIFEDAVQAARRRFGNLAKFRVQFLELSGGYVLKGGRRSKRRGVNRRSRSKEGEAMRYPAVFVDPL